MVLFLLIVIAVLLAILVLANDNARALLAFIVQGIICLAVLGAICVGLLMFGSYALSSPHAMADATFGVGMLVLLGGGAVLGPVLEDKLKQSAEGQRVIGGINAILGLILIAVLLGFGVWIFVFIATAAIQGTTGGSWIALVVAASIPALLGCICFGIAKQIGLIRTAPRPEGEG